MAILTRTKTVYDCDRCGHSTTNPYDKRQQMRITNQSSGMAYNGDIGGATLHYWLCGDCSRDFEKFMQGTAIMKES